MFHTKCNKNYSAVVTVFRRVIEECVFMPVSLILQSQILQEHTEGLHITVVVLGNL